MNRFVASALAITLASPGFAAGHATGDAAAGESVYNKCKACHMIEGPDEVFVKGGKVGPNQYGLHTRAPGSLEGFRYGDDLVAVGDVVEQWTEEEFVAYVADPRAYLREKLGDDSARSKMAFKRPDEQEARDVWAYIVSFGPDPES
jgi:cytochrome c